MRGSGRMLRKWLDFFRLRQLILRATTTRDEKKLLGMLPGTYLHDCGWYISRDVGASVDAKMNAIPWMTYPFLAFIKDRLSGDLRLFEFGAGSSTVYFSQHVKQVTAVEHEVDWFHHVDRQGLKNVRLIHQLLDIDGDYSRSCASQGQKYEIIIVDGRDRVNCIRHSIDYLTPDGILILDDSEREAYRPGHEIMLNQGFRRLDFWGVGPIVGTTCCTSIFYRTQNCLKI